MAVFVVKFSRSRITDNPRPFDWVQVNETPEPRTRCRKPEPEPEPLPEPQSVSESGSAQPRWSLLITFLRESCFLAAPALLPQHAS
jgi:hypothetical protein